MTTWHRLALVLVAWGVLVLVTPAHAQITFVDASMQPTEAPACPTSATSTYSTDPLVLAPPAGMVANDYVVVLICARTASVTWTASTTGGQTWTAETAQSGTTRSCQFLHTRFNGTWAANPQFDASTTPASQTAQMFVFRGVDLTTAIDVAKQSNTFVSGDLTAGAYTISPPSTATAGAMAIYCWMSLDDNCWTLAGGTGLTQKSGQERVRNVAGSDSSVSCGWKTVPTIGSPGAELSDETDVGESDDGMYGTLILRQAQPTVKIADDQFERAGPALGSNWTTFPLTGFVAPVITNSSDVISPSAAGGADAGAYWNANTFPSDDSYACVKLSGADTSSADASACIMVPGSLDLVCCAARSAGGGSATWELWSINNNGSYTSATGAALAWVVGDLIGIKRTSATAFQCYRALAASPTTWVGLGSGASTIANIASNGNPAMGFWLNSGTAATAFQTEQWEGGTGPLPTSLVCGAAVASAARNRLLN